MKFLEKIPFWILLLILGLILFLPFLGSVPLFDWDEINFAESAREMIETGNYLQVQINYQPFIEKPPFFIWLQALSMNLFGVNEFAARLPNALVGMVSLLVLLQVGAKLKDKYFGALWALVYVASFLPHFYFKSGLIDPLFNLFIFLAIFFASKLTESDEFFDKKGRRKYRYKAIGWSSFFIGLAILTKGPVGFLLFLLSFFLLLAFYRFRFRFSALEILYFFFVLITVVFLWYGIEWYAYGSDFIKGFFNRHIDLLTKPDAGHGGPFIYHLIVLLFGCFPASVFMFGGIKNHKFSTSYLHNFQRWMLALLIVVLTVFSIVQTKIIHYSSLSYFPITFFASYFLYYLLKGKRKWKWYHATLFLVVGVTWGTAITLVPLMGRSTDLLIDMINGKDLFAIENLKAVVFWSYYEVLYGLIFIAILIVVSVLFELKQKRVALAILLLSTTMMIQLLITLFVPRIEAYTQKAAIEFYKSKSKQPCYIETLGFKSYAPLFYGKKRVFLKPYTQGFLLEYDVPQAVYFVCKNVKKEKYMKEYPNLILLYEKNGFVFFEKQKGVK